MKTQKKFYLIYQITNTINGKFYIGKHETNQLDDEYMGSGTYLQRAQEKYGIQNFVKTILFQLHNEEEMNLLERMVVTPEFCVREDTYNINVGGDGGWSYCNLVGKRVLIQDQIAIDIQSRQYNCGQSMKQKIEQMSDDEYFQYCQKISSSLKQYKFEHPEWQVGKNNPMFGHVYTDETLQKMSNSHIGEKNHMAQKQWIRNPATHESKTILKTEPIPEGWEHGRYCKRK